MAVLGLARSGVALARFLADRGARVTVYDARPLEALGPSGRSARGRDVAAAARARTSTRPPCSRGQALVCTSPSVSSRFPTTEPRLRAALAAVEAEGRVPVVSEVDLFLRLCPARHDRRDRHEGQDDDELADRGGPRSGAAAGAAGRQHRHAARRAAARARPRHRVVLELSELQLPTLSRGTDVAVYTHVTADHLDRHGTVAAYRAVKRRLAELVAAGRRARAQRRGPGQPQRTQARPAGARSSAIARDEPPTGRRRRRRRLDRGRRRRAACAAGRRRHRR